MVPFSFARTGPDSKTGYTTLTHRPHAASLGPGLGGPFRLSVVLSMVALSSDHYPPFNPQKAVGAPIYPPPQLLPSSLFVLLRFRPWAYSFPLAYHHRALALWCRNFFTRRRSGSDNFHHPCLCSDPFRPTPFTMPYLECSLSHLSGPFFVRTIKCPRHPHTHHPPIVICSPSSPHLLCPSHQKVLVASLLSRRRFRQHPSTATVTLHKLGSKSR
jgi:hypothetical protein